MATFEQALGTLRYLLQAQNAVAAAIDSAIADVHVAARAEGKAEQALVQTARYTTSTVHKKINPSDIVDHIRFRWNAAVTEADRDGVRAMARAAVESGMVKDEAAAEVIRLTAA